MGTFYHLGMPNPVLPGDSISFIIDSYKNSYQKGFYLKRDGMTLFTTKKVIHNVRDIMWTYQVLTEKNIYKTKK
ncbi:MAG TPA: hypothetical protein VNX68_12890 [Nitrosopumilaceae archaeon]|jgi:hypothetical protein|nr:hypothetical protein [Nitrosopumilaceae archaeon]